jgi:hypothetical protein
VLADPLKISFYKKPSLFSFESSKIENLHHVKTNKVDSSPPTGEISKFRQLQQAQELLKNQESREK